MHSPAFTARTALVGAAALTTAVLASPAPAGAATVAVARDAMSRTLSGTWGSADLGGSYALNVPSAFSASSGAGWISVPKGTDRRAALPGVSAADADASFSFVIRAIPTTGSGVYLSPNLRQNTGGDVYRPRIRVAPGGAAYLSVLRVLGSTQASTMIGSEVKLPFTVSAGTWYRMRATVSGASPVTVTAKVWSRSAAEPATWQLSVTDSLAGRLTAAGIVGLWAYASASGSNTTIGIDDLNVTSTLPNVPPSAVFSSSSDGLTTTVDASASTDPDGTITTYAWSFGDGTTGTGRTAAHTYAKAGSYTVTLKVTDNDGATATTQKSASLVVPVKPVASTAGARLPIAYDPVTLPGTVRYVSPVGSDALGTGSISAPYATLRKAESASADGDTIVLRGGVYPIATNSTVIDRSRLTVIAYPGETPTFDGSVPASTAAALEGSLVTVPYQPIPAAVGEGLGLANLPAATFGSSGPTGLAAKRGWACVSGNSYVAPTSSTSAGCPSGYSPRVITGFYPDQVWVSGRALTQVMSPSRVVPGTFYVPRSSSTDAAPGAGRLYLSQADAADMSKVRVSSSRGTFLSITGDGVRLEGFRVVNHSPGWSSYAVLANSGVDDLVLRDLAFDANAAISVKLAGGGNAGGGSLVRRALLDRVSMTRPGWSGAAVLYTDDTVVRDSLFTGANSDWEFDSAPQSGAIKVTKSDRMKVEYSIFRDNVGHALWFDQSNYDATVAGSRFEGNTHSGVFYEISHGLTLVNNYLRSANTDATEAYANVRLAGSSGIKLVANTIVGGANGVLSYVDPRSKQYTAGRYCAEHTVRYGQGGSFTASCGGYTSDLDLARPGAFGTVNLTPGMNWMPSIDLMVNNVIANPVKLTAWTPCGGATALCLQGGNSASAWAELNSVIHPATVMNGNVYQLAGSGQVARFIAASGKGGSLTATDLAGLAGTAGLGSAYYNKSVEQAGRFGTWVNADGTPRAELVAADAQAADTPTDARVNAYVPAGTNHYGAYLP